MKILLAIDQADAEKYQAHYDDIEDALVRLVSEPNRIEGMRVTEAFATPRARGHDLYWECVEIVRHCRFLTTRTAPRIA